MTKTPPRLHNEERHKQCNRGCLSLGAPLPKAAICRFPSSVPALQLPVPLCHDRGQNW